MPLKASIDIGYVVLEVTVAVDRVASNILQESSSPKRPGKEGEQAWEKTPHTRPPSGGRRLRANGDDKEPRIAQTHLAVMQGRIEGSNAAQVGLEEGVPLGGVEGVEVRPQAGAADPLDDGLVVVEHVVVGGAPDVEVGAQRLQGVVELARRLERPAEQVDAPQLVRPRRLRRHLAHRHVRRLLKVVRHLEGEDAARALRAHQVGQERQAALVREPLEHGVREEEVRRVCGPERRQVRQAEVDRGQPLSRLREHVR